MKRVLKTPESIKECIRKNEHVAITLYRDGLPAMSTEAVGSKPSGRALENASKLGARAVARSLLLPAA